MVSYLRPTTNSKEVSSIELLRTMAQIPMDIEGDAFGKIYEYFLGNFAMAEGRAGRRILHTHLSGKIDCRDSPAVSKDGFWTQRAALAVCLSRVTEFIHNHRAEWKQSNQHLRNGTG